jgi:hypothetical protein
MSLTFPGACGLMTALMRDRIDKHRGAASRPGLDGAASGPKPRSRFAGPPARPMPKAGAAAALAVLLLSGGARGQAAAAEVLFEQGRAALAAGDFETACARFRASDQIDPGAGVRANLGTCEERRGRLASAWEAFRSALAKLPAGDTRQAKIQASIDALEPRLPRLVLALGPDTPRETTVSEGAAAIGTAGTFGVPLPFDPGVHHLTVTAPGRDPRPLDVTLTEGKTTTITVDVAAAPSAASASPGPWIVGGIGLAGLVVGGVTGALVLQKKSVTNADCTATSCTAAGEAAASAGRTLGPVSTVGLVVGAAGVTAGAVWLGVRRRGGGSARFGVAPTLAGATWRVEGSW